MISDSNSKAFTAVNSLAIEKDECVNNVANRHKIALYKLVKANSLACRNII